MAGTPSSPRASQSMQPATQASASSGRSGTGATAPTAQRTARRAGSSTRATEAVALDGPLRPVALRKTCGACSSGTRTQVSSSPGRIGSRPVSRWLTGTSRVAPGRVSVTLASSAASTGRVSPVGAAVAMLPPSVPTLRVCGGPAVRAASASAGMRAAKSGRSIRASVSPAPSTAVPPSS